MLAELRIQDLGVITDATIELAPGLNVLTGETGAGKTIVLSGLGLLLGDRADSSLVRTGATRAAVEGVLEMAAEHPAMARALDAGAELDDGGLIVARSVSENGRSRAHLGGRAAPAGVLSEIGRALVAVHGQADQWRLRQPEEHRHVLDAFGGPALLELRRDVEQAYEHWREATRALRHHAAAERARIERIDVLTSGLERIDAVDPQPQEDDDLRAESIRLEHADGLRENVGRALTAISGDDADADSDSRYAAIAALVGAQRELAAAAQIDESLEPLQARLSELVVLCGQIASELSSYAVGIEADPARLEWVHERRAELTALTKRFGSSLDEVQTWAEAARIELGSLTDPAEGIDALTERAAAAEARLVATAMALSEQRSVAALAFGAAVTHEIGALAMPHAVVEVAVRQDEQTAPARHTDSQAPVDAASGVSESGPPQATHLTLGDGRTVRIARHGIDTVEILMSANKGATPRTVSKAASGGELSRLMLAIEVVTARGREQDGPETFVFDEVDAGIGGEAALAVGSRLAALAEHYQVVVVTHLAQVAAFADRHHVITKDHHDAVTRSSVVTVADEAQLAELARMMGGDSSSEAGIAHAEDLLRTAHLLRSSGEPSSAARRG